MGIEIDRFVDNLPQESLCPICCLVLREPVSTPCKHYVCQECWISWRKGPSGDLCPYCCSNIPSTQKVERSSTIWKLILNFNVYCKYNKQGCTSIYKLGLEDIHLKNCPLRNNLYNEESCTEDENWNAKTKSSKCSTCFNTIIDSKKHNCLETLLETLKQQSIKITNLEYENDRLSLRLTTKENGIMDQISILESRNQQDALDYEKEIRQLKTRIATLYGELRKTHGEIEEIDVGVTLERQDGSLGLNIVGGHQDGKEASGIFISRIAENGPASKPGKLQLNDRVLEVNGVDLRNATHDQAVQAFKNSHGPVRMLVRRQVKVDSKKQTTWTQTEDDLPIQRMVDSFLETNNNVSSSDSVPPKSCDHIDSALPSGSEADDSLVLVNENGTRLKDVYDSAYDTLLTQKSSRSSREYSLDESISQIGMPLDENEDVSSECSEDIRTLTPGTDRNGYGSSSSNRINSPAGRNSTLRRGSLSTDDSLSPVHEVKMRQKNNGDTGRSSTIRRGSLSTDDSLSPVHEVKMRQKNNGDTSSPRKVIRRSTYYLVEESLDEISNNVEINGERKQSVGQESVITASSNDIEYEYEYEHVSLRKENGKFGIQLCCGGEDDAVGVYITKIETGSVVEISGQIMVGDQLIQINNSRVHSVEEACKILENNDNLTLVVARPVIEVNEQPITGLAMKTDEAPLNTVIECESEVDISSSEPSTAFEHVDNSSNDRTSVTEALSEISRPSEQWEIEKNRSQADSASLGREKSVEFESKTETRSEVRDDVKASLKDYVLSRLRGGNKDKRKDSDVNSDKSSTLERVKERTLERHRKKDTPNATPSSSRKNSTSRKETRNSNSSNSAVGSDSNPSPIHESESVSPIHESKLAKKPARSAMKKPTSKHRSPKHVRVDSKPDWTMTEKRVWEEFKIIQNMEAEGEKDQDVNLSSVEAEWKVRRSKDGKHIYIRKQTSKSQKSKLLKERAERLAVERTGVTTDDDANTIYLGRFWNKEERKRQLLRHRLKRERILERQIAKDAIPPNPMDVAIAEIVQKKMTAPGHVFDDFVTVEEILTQRNRDGISEGPIHVTTV